MEKEIKVLNFDDLSEAEKVDYAFQMFKMYFPKTYKILKDKSFMTLVQFKENLMTLDKSLIEEETSALIKEHMKLLYTIDLKSFNEFMKFDIGFDTPQQRFNCYKYASNAIGLKMAMGIVKN